MMKSVSALYWQGRALLVIYKITMKNVGIVVGIVAISSIALSASAQNATLRENVRTERVELRDSVAEMKKEHKENVAERQEMVETKKVEHAEMKETKKAEIREETKGMTEEERQQFMEVKKLEMQEERSFRESEILQERAISIANRQVVMVGRLQVAAERFSSVINKVEERITAFDDSAADGYIADAKESVVQAQAAIDQVAAVVIDSTDRESFKASVEDLKTEVKEVRSNLREAHNSLKLAVSQIKANRPAVAEEEDVPNDDGLVAPEDVI